MRPQAHLAASLLVWSAGRGSPAELPVCLVAGNLPDFDRNVARALGVRRRDHHRWISHSFVGWFPPTAAVAWRGRRGRSRGAVARGLASLWIHLLLDTYADGLAWLWPVRKDKIGLFRQPPEIKDDGWRTPAPLHTNLGRIEAALWLGAALCAARRVPD